MTGDGFEMLTSCAFPQYQLDVLERFDQVIENRHAKIGGSANGGNRVDFLPIRWAYVIEGC